MKEKKKFQAPSTPVLMLILIIILSILTYIVPAGSFDRIEDPETGIVNIDVESFHFVDRDASNPDGPQSEGPFQMFVDIYDGLVNAADLIFLIFIGCWVAIILHGNRRVYRLYQCRKKSSQDKDSAAYSGLYRRLCPRWFPGRNGRSLPFNRSIYRNVYCARL